MYRSYKFSDLETDKKSLKLETLRFPDISCNWSAFSKPTDIWYRQNSRLTDGCYSFTVKDSRFCNIATPFHDPLTGQDIEDENYSHVEIRALKEGESFNSKIPKGRTINSRKKKVCYRIHIKNKMKFHLIALPE